MKEEEARDAECSSGEGPNIELVVRGRPRDLGGFSVRRALPSARRRLVGPFIFFDHMGPASFAPHAGIDVRPHPHIALATITYLFEGSIFHRDSLGSALAIRPGDVNWMVAGRGIVHSERTPAEVRSAAARLHGIQTWVALPTEHEETEPRFEHHPSATLPRRQQAGVSLCVIAGAAYGMRSPVSVYSPTLYVHASLDPRAALEVDQEHEERAVYVASGVVECDGCRFDAGALVILKRQTRVTVAAVEHANLLLIGGAALSGPRHIWWNFVSSSEERIERAKADWREGRFPKVPGDEIEFIPLPEQRI